MPMDFEIASAKKNFFKLFKETPLKSGKANYPSPPLTNKALAPCILGGRVEP